jgi:hypothetical protein
MTWSWLLTQSCINNYCKYCNYLISLTVMTVSSLNVMCPVSSPRVMNLITTVTTGEVGGERTNGRTDGHNNWHDHTWPQLLTLLKVITTYLLLDSHDYWQSWQSWLDYWWLLTTVVATTVISPEFKSKMTRSVDSHETVMTTATVMTQLMQCNYWIFVESLFLVHWLPLKGQIMMYMMYRLK